MLVEGGPGCGKTFLSVGVALQWLQQEKIERAVFCQTTSYISKQMGFTSGNFHEKCLDFFWQPRQYFEEFVGVSLFKRLIADRTIEMVSTELLRGRNFANALVVLDEAQLCSKYEILTFVSRMSTGSKLLIMGDRHQSELTAGTFFAKMMDGFEDEAVGKILFEEGDCLRHSSMSRIFQGLTKL